MTEDRPGRRRRDAGSRRIEAFPVSGGGPEITGPCDQFVLVATGRAEPARLGLDEPVNIYR